MQSVCGVCMCECVHVSVSYERVGVCAWQRVTYVFCVCVCVSECCRRACVSVWVCTGLKSDQVNSCGKNPGSGRALPCALGRREPRSSGGREQSAGYSRIGHGHAVGSWPFPPCPRLPALRPCSGQRSYSPPWTRAEKGDLRGLEGKKRKYTLSGRGAIGGRRDPVGRPLPLNRLLGP